MMVLPTLAIETLNEIQEAFDATMELDSFRMRGSMNIEQSVNVSGSEAVNQVMLQSYEAEFTREDDTDYAVYIQIDQSVMMNSSSQIQRIKQTMEMMLVEGEIYVQFGNISPSDLSSMYPLEWMPFAEAHEQFAGLQFFNPEQLHKLMTIQGLGGSYLAYGINDETVSDYEVLSDKIVDNQTMKRFSLEMNVQDVLSDEVLSELFSTMDFSSLGIDISEIKLEFGEDSSAIYTLSFSEDDNLLHMIESEVDMTLILDGAAFGLTTPIVIDQTASAALEFYDFDVPITIEAPK